MFGCNNDHLFFREIYSEGLYFRDRGGGGAGRAIALPLFCLDLFSRALVDMEKITL